MRRLILALSLCLIVTPAWAQVQQMNKYPSGILDYTSTSVSISNSSTATTIYTKTIPARIEQQFRQMNFGSYALHLKLLGSITTSLFPGAVNVGCNYGGANASIALINGATPTASLTAAPLELDLYVRRIAGSVELVFGRVGIQSGTTTLLPYAALNNYGTVSTASNQTLACTWQWGSASTSNAVVIYNAVLEEGA